ncbi:hypothetical protein AGMMS49992_09490 [Clostridia bacterium]|nr:hypothetical protein AGMMS49992_09490 [Clostridia bacterium]
MVTYGSSKPEDRAEILDFANMVFSMAHRPHNFAEVLPKVYAEGAPLYRPDMHYIAKADGRITGLVAMLPIPMRVCGQELTVGYIGTVSTHPYYRSQGAMKALMGLMLDDAKRLGFAYLSLGGRRQRYGYFGFTNAGMKTSHHIEGPNVRHGLSGVDSSRMVFRQITDNGDPLLDDIFAMYDRLPVSGARTRDTFLIISQSWGCSLHAVMWDGDCVGWAITDNHGIEVALSNPDELARPFMKAWHEAHGDYTLAVPLHDLALQREAMSVSEDFDIGSEGMINVVDWQKTLSALLALKRLTHPLQNGQWTIQIEDGQPLTLEVTGHSTRVDRDGRPADVRFTKAQAQDAIFSREALILPTAGAPSGWFPLSLGIRGADKF